MVVASEKVVPEKTVALRVGSLALDARLAVPDDAVVGCVVCHPHPQYGGDMRNPVVVAVVAALQEAGLATLRFDFRGTGASTGTHSGGDGEVDDARAALDAMASVPGIRRVAIAGYSFGAWIALRLAAGEPRLSAVAAIAPPLAAIPASGLGAFRAPLLLLAGDLDSWCPVSALESFVASRPASETLVLRGADHFLVRRERDAAVAVSRFLRTIPSPADEAPA